MVYLPIQYPGPTTGLPIFLATRAAVLVLSAGVRIAIARIPLVPVVVFRFLGWFSRPGAQGDGGAHIRCLCAAREVAHSARLT